MTSTHRSASPSRRTLIAGTVGAGGALGVSAVAGPAAAAASSGEHGRRDGDWPDGPGRSVRPQRPTDELRRMPREMDPARIDATIRRLVAFGTRHTLSSQDDPRRGIGAARDWLFDELSRSARASGGRMTVAKQSYVQQPASRIPVPTRITNVVATLRGSSEPERVYVVSGHYDSRVTDVMDATSDAPGADDDASGVAVVLEMARVMARHRPAATIVFAAVAGEEQGLYGSTYLAESFRTAGTDVQAMFTNDIVGSPTADDGTRDPRSLRLFAEGVPSDETPEEAAVRRSVGGENDSPARQLARFVSDVAHRDVTGMDVRVVYRRDRYLRGGDHIPFLERGFPAGRFTEPNEDYDHQHQDVRVEDGRQIGDLPEFCDPRYVAGVARVNAATLWSLATAPGTPTDVTVETTELTNDTVLHWAPTPGAARHEVVWRPTTEPDWTHVIDAGSASTLRVDLSKDNVVFGVRSVGRDGRRSPAAFPQPQR